jgi:hypothetical protein
VSLLKKLERRYATASTCLHKIYDNVLVGGAFLSYDLLMNGIRKCVLQNISGMSWRDLFFGMMKYMMIISGETYGYLEANLRADS